MQNFRKKKNQKSFIPLYLIAKKFTKKFYKCSTWENLEVVHCCDFTLAFSPNREMTIHHSNYFRITYGKLTSGHATYAN